MRVLESGFTGMLVAIALGVLAYLLAPFFDAVGVYAAPAQLLLPIIGALIPSTVVFRLVPEGGAPAGILLIMTCTLLFWTVVLGSIHFLVGSLRRPRQ